MRVNIPKGYSIALCYVCSGNDFVVKYDDIKITQRVKQKAKIFKEALFKNDTKNKTEEKPKFEL